MRDTNAKLSGPIVLLGRICFVFTFVLGTTGHFNGQDVLFAVQAGVPMAKILVPLSGAIAVVGGLSILLGYNARIGGWLIVLFLVPVTLVMHNFWAAKNPAMHSMQMIQFSKNLSMLGAALLISQCGAGPWSVDARLSVSKRLASPSEPVASQAR